MKSRAINLNQKILFRSVDDKKILFFQLSGSLKLDASLGAK